MPIYEYRCSACGHELESLQKLSEAPLLKCPACAKDTLTKLLSAAGFQLKGSGWYATDFKGSGSKPAAKAGADKAAVGDEVKAADAKPAAGTESKSDTASDTKAAPAATPAASTSPGTSSGTSST